MNTNEFGYSSLLLKKGDVWWKRLLDVQAPYRWNLRRLNPGFTIDIGCGLGRNLLHLNGNGVGIDHNQHAVAIARSRGLQAFTTEDFKGSQFNRADLFDSILLSHVAEHLTETAVVELLREHVPLLKQNGQVIIICPQDYGYRSDPTHVQFLDFGRLRNIARQAGLMPVREYSFPFPRVFGHLFKYNEFVAVSRKGPE
ncbi:MAG TPA: class I SAM-dependent methyltransferase [Blastocatellia bacterium]|nr:class I SAM-dependent methyltransferase [Blastocatellia bacterium]